MLVFKLLLFLMSLKGLRILFYSVELEFVLRGSSLLQSVIQLIDNSNQVLTNLVIFLPYNLVQSLKRTPCLKKYSVGRNARNVDFTLAYLYINLFQRQLSVLSRFQCTCNLRFAISLTIYLIREKFRRGKVSSPRDIFVTLPRHFFSPIR